MIRASMLCIFALSMPAMAQAPAQPPVRAELDCGSLRGVGAVVVFIGNREILVPVECGRGV
jgi:hypothetical protein